MTELNMEELQLELETLRKENKELRAEPELTCKVSPKGAVSIYGLHRFPVTLYADQMNRLLAFEEEIRTFIKDNSNQLTTR